MIISIVIVLSPEKLLFLVTEDKHFSILKNIPFPKIATISIEDFLIMPERD